MMKRKAVVPKDDNGDAQWQCENCTFLNSMRDRTCAMCCLGWSGEREVSIVTAATMNS